MSVVLKQFLELYQTRNCGEEGHTIYTCWYLLHNARKRRATIVEECNNRADYDMCVFFHTLLRLRGARLRFESFVKSFAPVNRR